MEIHKNFLVILYGLNLNYLSTLSKIFLSMYNFKMKNFNFGNIILISIIFQMKQQKLSEKVVKIKSASDFEHKLIDSIYHFMSMKRKAENDYKIALESIHKEVERYLLNDSGFLDQIMRGFQSYIAVLYQNQCTLIEGYDT